jgi:hypothetical protein
LKTLGQGQISDSVLDKMAMTFTALVKLGDFTSPLTAAMTQSDPLEKSLATESEISTSNASGLKLGGLVYNIQIVLPESRDSAVYDALFSSLRKHVL